MTTETSRCNVVGFVFARGGSKGVPRKNLRTLDGKPLIAHAILCGLASRRVRRVVVSTDDQEIAEVARQWGAEVPFMRPPELAGDNAPEWLAWRHAINALKAREGEAAVEVFAAIPCTAPLRLPADLDACVEEFMKGEADVVFTVTAARRNPYFSMVTLDDAGYAHSCLPRGEGLFRRQDAPRVYDIVPAAYVVRPRFIEEADNMFAGRIRTVEVPEDRAVDIDTETDLLLAEVLLARRGAGAA